MLPEPEIADRRSRRNDADDPREAEAPGAQDLPARIVNAAIALAEERGRWSAVRLHDVAGRLGVPTSQVLDHFPDLDSVADAWFMRALKAMVSQKPPEFLELPEWRRIELCLLAWFDALAPHRRVTAQMLGGKLHLPHLHHWVPMIFSLSRTVQWLREAAQLSGEYETDKAKREEVGLTAVFLAALLVWTRDDSEGQERTRRFLRRELRPLG
jgi:ubiquinone biosynthesis protein COQ9